MNNIIRSVTVASIILVALIAFNLCTYTVSQNENAIITQFGKPLGKPVAAGLHLKWPFIWTVNRLDVRIHEWDGKAADMPTRDKLYMTVDSFGRWQITDPLKWFTSLRDVRTAQSRMEDIIGSEIRNAVANNDLIEIVRTDKNRKPVQDQTLQTNTQVALPPITIGRTAIEQEIIEAATPKLSQFGIGLLDVRLMRLNYSAAVRSQINSRMISERKQIADRFRSEGEGEAAKILGNKERELQEDQIRGLRTGADHQRQSRRPSHRNLRQSLQPVPGLRGVLCFRANHAGLQEYSDQRHVAHFIHGQRCVPIPKDRQQSSQTITAGNAQRTRKRRDLPNIPRVTTP